MENLDNIIYYDANFSIGSHRGMGKYINKFIKVLHVEFDLIPIALLVKGKKISEKYFSFGFSQYFLWEQISLYFFQKSNNGLFIYPYNTAPIFLNSKNKNVLIIHDLIFMNQYKSISVRQIFGNLYRKLILPRIIYKFEKIITVSNYSKNKIANHFKIDTNKIFVIPNTIDLDNHLLQNNIKFNERSNIIFHIGGEPLYKNTETVVRAFAIFIKKINTKYILKIVGINNKYSLKYYNNLCKDLNIQDNIIFLPYQTDNEIINLYTTSKMFILPSLEEGFGIPIIEALKYGCPLICSNVSCLPEVAGDAALYFNPYSIEDLSFKIFDILSNVNNTNERVQLGYSQVQKFSFDNFKEKVKNWYRN